MNLLYRNLVLDRVRYALTAARSAQILEHSGVKGAVREALVAGLFRPLLPAGVDLTTGVIISAFDDKQSPQMDIIIYERAGLPPIAFEGGPSVLPIEAVIATIEVKSVLTLAELRAAHVAARELGKLDQHSGHRKPDGTWDTTLGMAPAASLFALDSDLTVSGKDEMTRYQELLEDEIPHLRSLCVAGRQFAAPQEGYVYDKPTGTYIRKAPGSGPDRWWYVNATPEHDEVLAFVAGLHSLVAEAMGDRGRPPLAAYLTGEATA